MRSLRRAVGVCSNHVFSATRVFAGAPAPRAAAAPPPAATEPVRMLAAAGPFSCSDDLAYAPLDALLETAAKEVPAALILLGPFVDENHPMMTEVQARSP